MRAGKTEKRERKIFHRRACESTFFQRKSPTIQRDEIKRTWILINLIFSLPMIHFEWLRFFFVHPTRERCGDFLHFVFSTNSLFSIARTEKGEREMASNWQMSLIAFF
jgi:hypothetical protein